MKVLYIRRHTDGSLSIAPGVDSGVLRMGEPVFIDEDTQAWTTEVAVALRISRLGFHIPVKHASKHYDAVAAVHLLWPLEQPADGLPPLFRDRALSPGAWVSLEELKGTSPVLSVERKSLRDNKDVNLQISRNFSLDILHADEIVAELSRAMTLKTGDMIVFAIDAMLGAPIADTSITASISGIDSLSIRIK